MAKVNPHQRKYSFRCLLCFKKHFRRNCHTLNGSDIGTVTRVKAHGLNFKGPADWMQKSVVFFTRTFFKKLKTSIIRFRPIGLPISGLKGESLIRLIPSCAGPYVGLIWPVKILGNHSSSRGYLSLTPCAAKFTLCLDSFVEGEGGAYSTRQLLCKKSYYIIFIFKKNLFLFEFQRKA